MTLPTVADHNATLRAGQERAEELLPRLERLVRKVLDEAAREAASRFAEMATDHLIADARRHADRRVVNGLDPAEARGLVASLGLTAAVDVKPNSTMVCVMPRPDEADAIADPDGEPPELLHVTLCYLGEIDGPLDAIVDALQPVAAGHAPLTGTVAGYGQFGTPDDERVGILLPDVPGLVELRVAVSEALYANGIDYSRDHGFEAHITVDTSPEPDEGDEMLPAVYGKPLHFDALMVVRGNTETVTIPLVGMPPLTADVGAPPPWTPPAGDEISDVDALVSRLRGKTDPVRQAVVATMMTETVNSVGIAFDPTNPFADRIFEQSASQVVDIAETTQLNVMRIIRRSYEEGLSIPETAKAIRAGMRGASAARATLIARTELVGATNGGSLAAMQIVTAATDLVYHKTWLTAPGAEYPRHEEYEGLDEQTVGLDDTFDVGGYALAFPGDPDGPPDEICNCRCTMVYTDEAGGGEIDSGE